MNINWKKILRTFVYTLFLFILGAGLIFVIYLIADISNKKLSFISFIVFLFSIFMFALYHDKNINP